MDTYSVARQEPAREINEQLEAEVPPDGRAALGEGESLPEASPEWRFTLTPQFGAIEPATKVLEIRLTWHTKLSQLGATSSR